MVLVPAITLLFIGALLGYDISRDTLGVYNALRAGRWFRVLFWAVFGGLVGGVLGLLAKYTTPHDFSATMPESPFLTWLLWMAVGVAFGKADGRGPRSPQNRQGQTRRVRDCTHAISVERLPIRRAPETHH